MAQDHLSPLTLRDYRRGRLNPDDALRAGDHLTACAPCRDALAAADNQFGGAGPAGATSATGGSADLAPAYRELAGPAVWGAPGSPAAPGGEGPPHPTPAEPRRRAPWLLPLAATAVTAALLAAAWWHAGPPPATATGEDLLTDADGRRADLGALPADLREAVARTLREGRAPDLTPLPGLLPPGAVAAAEPSAFRPLEPVGTVVRTRRPRLRWTPRPEATGYVVTVDPVAGAASAALVSPELPAARTEWVPPEPLAAGETYRWEVTARRGGETLDHAPAPAPAGAEARFRILDDGRRAELARLEAAYGRFPLILAVASALAGLTEEARAQFRSLAGEHPRSFLAARLGRDGAAAATPAPSPSPSPGGTP